jgi:uncharacterized protein (DUF362 family)
MRQISRRKFIKLLGAFGVGAALSGTGCSSPQTVKTTSTPATAPAAASQPRLVVVRGPNPTEITRRAIAALGGMEQFVKSGATVVIKPNICVAYHSYEYAATTNPEVVAELVRLCKGAGAKRVRVMDTPFGGSPDAAYEITGIKKAVEAAGGEMEIMSPVKFRDTPFPKGVSLKNWPVYQDILDADLLINVPIAKHHNLARLTLGGKNLLGVAGTPNQFHSNLGQRIADLVSVVRPALTVIDAVRILVDHGPTGGSLQDVKKLDTIIASQDIVAADAYGATLFNLKGQDIAYIKAAAAMGLGTLDLSSVKIEELSV